MGQNVVCTGMVPSEARQALLAGAWCPAAVPPSAHHPRAMPTPAWYVVNAAAPRRAGFANASPAQRRGVVMQNRTAGERKVWARAGMPRDDFSQ